MSDNNELMDIVKQTAFNIASVSEQMGILSSNVKDLKRDVIGIKQDIDDYKTKTDLRMQSYEDSVRVSRTQAQNIRNSIHARAAELLGIVYKDGVITDKVGLYNDKYYRSGFISRCYVDARKQSRLGTPYTETLKRDYEEVLKFINEWDPPTGKEGYKAYLDARRKK